ncbi:uncharacterized protein LOC103369816 isoform X2 [Stegastes partitus]|nr:PREDICTED: uncharacterized protein LOC103369816 isoform X2 [Stegastes partitus]
MTTPSTSITTVGGMVVVTQVIPKDENFIPLQTPDNGPPKAPPPATKAPPPAKKTPAKVDNMTTAFLRGAPMNLGIVQICIGLVCVMFSGFALLSPNMLVSAPLCFAVTFVISGSLAVAARRGTSISLVWACLVSHVISVLFGLACSAYVCWLMAVRKVSNVTCDPQSLWDYRDPDVVTTQCMDKVWFLQRLVGSLFGLLLVLLVLQVCVAITVCVFSGKAIRLHRHYSPIKVEVDDHGALLDSDVEEDRYPALA